MALTKKLLQSSCTTSLLINSVAELEQANCLIDTSLI